MNVANKESWPVSATISGHVCLVDADAALRARVEQAMTQGEDSRLDVFSCPHARAALQHLKRFGADVVVVGNPAGPTNAAQLLRRVQDKFPQSVRVVLSNEEPRVVFRRAPYAHQFFSPEVNSKQLRSSLVECLQLQSLLRRPKLRALVSSKNALPATPQLYSQLIDKLGDPRCSMVKIADIIEKDVAMSTRLLQVVSSAFFGLPSEMRSIGACVAYLGIDTIRSLVLSEEISRSFPALVPGFSSEGLQARALSISRLTRRLAADMAEPNQAFIAGLLHGVGQLVLAARAPKEFAEALQLSEREKIPLAEAELQVLGATNAEVGAYLLGIWGLPLGVVRAVAAQEAPETVDEHQPGLATITYLGKRLSADPEVALVPELKAHTGISEAYLAQIGVLESLPAWRELAARLGA